MTEHGTSSNGASESRGRSSRSVDAERRERTFRFARIQCLLLAGGLIATLVVFSSRREIARSLPNIPTRIVAIVLVFLFVLGLVNRVGPALRFDLLQQAGPRTVSLLAFVARLTLVFGGICIELAIAGVDLVAVAVSSVFIAVVVGVAAQPVLANVVAGAVLAGRGPFVVGSRVRLQGGAVGGQIEGEIESIGLMYLTLREGSEIMVLPNSVVQQLAVALLGPPTLTRTRQFTDDDKRFRP